ncbi:MAG: PHP domain-containing protein [Candidatus Micrarchaeia archaeon]
MVISLEEFRNIINTQSYIFHIHTNYTDGKSSVEDYFKYAKSTRVKYLIFTEHVRKNLTYNFDFFIQDIQEKCKNYDGIKGIVGCEAKILPDGSLDISEQILSKLEVICIACHLNMDSEIYGELIKRVFTSNTYRNHIKVWVHPGLFLKKNSILYDKLDYLRDLVKIAICNDILIEKNLKYQLPPLEILYDIPEKFIILGYDAHSIEDLEKKDSMSF